MRTAAHAHSTRTGEAAHENAKAFHDKCGKQWKCWDACRLNTQIDN
ncbi:hypothetical protein ABLN72_02110 [Mycobacterium tuberculosis]